MAEMSFPKVYAKCIVLIAAVCMLSVMLPVGTVRAAVVYTGSVTPTDETGLPKDTYFQGESVFVNVELKQAGLPYSGSVTVQLVRTTDGAVVSSFTRTTNFPDIGWFNSSGMGVHLETGAGFLGDTITYDVVERYAGDVVARHPIIVKATGLTLQPRSSIISPFYPGQTVSMRLMTQFTTEVFYVQFVNETGVTVFNITGQVALTGSWSYDWMIPSDFPDGRFSVNVNDAATHVTRYSVHVYVQKFLLFTNLDRMTYLTGETASIYYLVLDTETLAPSTGVSIEYSAEWLDGLGAPASVAGTLPGVEGTHNFTIPFDAALYQDVILTYWANETATGRSFSDQLSLNLGMLTASVYVSENTFNPGEQVSIEVSAAADFSDIEGAVVNISVELDGYEIPAYSAIGLLTDEFGFAHHAFMLAPSASGGTYIVNVTVEQADHTSQVMTVFNVVIQAEILVEFDKPYYYSGDTALVQFRVIRNGLDLSGLNLTYIVVGNAEVLLTAQNTTGYLSYSIPLDFYGVLMIQAMTNLDGVILSGTSTCSVLFAELSLTSDRSEYSPGDIITFNYQLFTNLASGIITWEVSDAEGARVAYGTPAFSKVGTFSYDTPTTWCSESYTASMTFWTLSGGYLVASETVTKAPVPPILLIPFLRVDNPVEGAVTSVPVILANGSTEQGILLFVNGFTVLTMASGEFSLNLPLLEGVNTITITANGGMGQATVTRNVTFANPVPGLATQLSALASDLVDSQASISAIWARLNSTVGDVSTIWAQLNSSEAAIGTIWADLNATDSTLDDVQTMVDALRAELTQAHQGLNTTDANLLLLEASVDVMQAQLDSTRASLNATVSDLTAAQTQIDSVQADLEDSQGEIGTKATKSSVTMWFAVALVISVVLVAALYVMLRRKE